MHGFCQHLGSHPEYTKLVEERVEKIKDIFFSEENKKPHEKIKDLVKGLRDEEHNIWKDLVEDCRKIIRNEQSVADHIGEKEKNGTRAYKLI